MMLRFRRPCTMIAGAALALIVSTVISAEKDAALPQGWVKTLAWRCVGPANMGGRITDVAVFEGDPKTWWAATASGGLLKTTNNGTTFEHQFQHEATVSIGDIAVAPSDPAIIWVGTGESNPRNSVSWGNGVYKSTDGGETWQHKGLDGSFQIGRIEIHPENPDVVYVGALGRLWGPNEERGLYKTTDGGETWQRILQVDENTGVVDLQMKPDDPDTLLVATYHRRRDGFDSNDPAEKWGPGSGLYLTTDAGQSFVKVTEGLPQCQLGRIGISWYRADPNIVYAIVESQQIGREPENAAFAGLSGEDAEVGARLTEVVEDGPAAAAGLQVGDIVIRVEDSTVHSNEDLLTQIRKRLAGDTVQVEVSRERESVITEMTFARRPGSEEDAEEGDEEEGDEEAERRRRRETRSPFAGRLGGQRENVHEQQGPDGRDFGGVYRSNDAGRTWARINSVNPRPMYFSQIRVDPSDNSHLWVLGVSLYKSKDGGATFTDDGASRGVHVDHHAMWVDPDDGRHIILGNDGGIYVTYDRGENWEHLNRNAIGQFYHVTVDPRPNYMVYGGLQDNGSWGGPARARDGSGPINEDWFRVGGGDGFVCRVDKEDPDQVYFESQNGGLGRFNLRSGDRGFMRPRAPRGTRYRWNWKTPFILSNHNSRIFYTAGNHVFRSLNRGEDMKQISPEITNTDRGSATALNESPLDSDVLYVGSDDGALWMTRNGGHGWINLFDITAEQAQAADSEEADRRGAGGEAAAPGEGRGGGRRGGRFGGARMIEMLRSVDADGDGKVARSEFPERMARMFDRIDTNDDDVIDEKEIEALASRGDAGDQPSSSTAEPPPAGSSQEAEKPSEQPVEVEVEATEVEVEESGAVLEPAPEDMPSTEPGEQAPPETESVPAEGEAAQQSDEPVSEVSEAAAALEPADEPAEAPVAPHQEVETAAQPEPAEEVVAASDDPLTGRWLCRIQRQDMPEGSGEFTLILNRGEDNTVTGHLTSRFNDGDIEPGVFDPESGKLTFAFIGDQMSFDVEAQLAGGALTGELQGEGGAFTMPFTAERVSTDLSAEEGAAQPDDQYDWFPISDLVPGPRGVSSIEPSRFEAGRVYLALDGHRSDDDEPYIFVSENYGRTWRPIRGDLPTSAGSTRVLREDLKNPELLYLGTEFGVYVSIDRGETWTRLNSNLPTVAVHEIAQHPSSGDIVVATHGRSIWITDATALRQMTTEVVSNGANLYQPADVHYWRSEPSRGGSLPQFNGQNPNDDAEIYYSINGNAQSVEVRVTDRAGEVLHEEQGSTEPGLHRLSWNLRRAADESPRQQRFRRGPRVEPAVYVAELEVDGMIIRKHFRVHGDPEFPDAILWGEAYDEMLEQLEAFNERD